MFDAVEMQAAALMGPVLPRAAGALAILAGAWLLARLLRSAVLRFGAAQSLDRRSQFVGLSATLASVVSGLVWLMALPALLGALDMQGLLAPVNAMMSRLLGFLPNLLGAAVVLAIGLLMARIVAQIVAGLLRAAGSEKAAAKMGMSSSLGEGGLAGTAGTVVFALLMLPVLVAALQPLGLDGVTQPLSRLLESVIGFIPRLFSAAIVLGLAVLIGRTLATLVSASLDALGLSRLAQRFGISAQGIAGRSLSDLVGMAVLVATFMVALTQACQILGLQVLTDAVGSLSVQLMRLALAALIFGCAWVLARLAGQSVQAQLESRGQPYPQVWAVGCRAAILFVAGALALVQAGLPTIIVSMAFGAVAGGIAVGLAVALGIGGGPVAGRLLQRASDALAPAAGQPTPPGPSLP